MRDRAIEGLSVLARRDQWRTSAYGAQIASRVVAALDDESPVVRMQAAAAFAGLHAEASSEERVAGIRDRLIGESNVMVRIQFLELLRWEAHASPAAVDAVMEVMADPAIGDDERAESADSEGEGERQSSADRADTERRNLHTDITTFLALTHETPYALSALNDWVSNPAKRNELHRAIPFVRDYLAPIAEPSIQKRAFEFVSIASESALKHWNDMGAVLADSGGEPSPDQVAELQTALRVLDTTADQIYFASGAFERKRVQLGHDDSESHDVSAEDLARFADLAIPTLLVCAASKAAPVIHHVVETLVYLAQVDEKRSLTALAEAVNVNSNYSYDSLAGGVVIPYLVRLLAEQRDLVLFDEEGVTAFRSLLAAFAGAGNEEALVLAFTFADIFR